MTLEEPPEFCGGEGRRGEGVPIGTGASGVGEGAAADPATCPGGGNGVPTMLAEYPMEDAACGGSTSTVPEKIV